MAVRTTRITIQTETLTVVRHAKASLAWCPTCAAEVDVINLAPDRMANRADSAELEQWLNDGKLHLWRLPDSTVQICVNSLLGSWA